MLVLLMCLLYKVIMLFFTQVFLLQHNENEALSPSQLQDKIMAMLQASPDIAEAVSHSNTQ